MSLSQPCQSRRGRSGFTLIEIMMVVAIIGLTLTTGLPAFLRVMNKEGMRKAEYDMVEACQEARRAAIMNNATTDLVIHPQTGEFSVPGAFSSVQLPPDIGIDILGVNFIESKDFDEARVHFKPNGTSDEFTIILHSTGGQMMELDLDPIGALPVVKMLR
jgi:prepilin-type N-terminal cleavage/methylation domain-containing protein